MIAVGTKVDDFSLPAHDGTEVHWEELRGSPVVFFFYPKASTPGCTKEACAFRDLASAFASRGVKVFGVSADSIKRQQNFATKYELTMPLLSDADKVILEPWGVWGEKKMYGKTYEGIIRSTFVFDAGGVLRHVWPKVKVTGHADEVLSVVDDLFRD